ncbi:hypothetical protein M9H77_33681 [Catharanthus roseus]|uniref:Uncharacterized protein n=1 Tax=Catharanthus roseus TaxID=4058 RepID=A0ACB9ZJ37_CATRO|nr:hypothetical protein M9H77_33681 [Catharanthus roseus]
MGYRSLPYSITIKILESSRNLFNSSIFPCTKYFCGLAWRRRRSSWYKCYWIWSHWMRCSGNVLVQEATWIGWIRDWARGVVLSGQDRNRSLVAGMEALGRAISRERIGWAMRARLCALGLAVKRNRYGWAVCTGPIVNNFDHCSLDKLGILLLELLARLKVSTSATNCVPPRWSIVAILAHALADRSLCVSCYYCLAVPRPEDGRDLPRHPPLLLRSCGVPRSRLLQLSGGLLRLQCLQIMPYQVEDNEPGDERR